jgi:hypothetical protein
MCEVMEKYMAEARAEAKTKSNIIAVVNMFKLNVEEAAIKECYPDEFEEGKRRFLDTK